MDKKRLLQHLRRIRVETDAAIAILLSQAEESLAESPSKAEAPASAVTPPVPERKPNEILTSEDVDEIHAAAKKAGIKGRLQLAAHIADATGGMELERCPRSMKRAILRSLGVQGVVV